MAIAASSYPVIRSDVTIDSSVCPEAAAPHIMVVSAALDKNSSGSYFWPQLRRQCLAISSHEKKTIKS